MNRKKLIRHKQLAEKIAKKHFFLREINLVYRLMCNGNSSWSRILSRTPAPSSYLMERLFAAGCVHPSKHYIGVKGITAL